MIGVFDSGLGGLTILKEFLNKLPEYDYVYLGDNARAPYGNKSAEVIYNYTKEAVDFLFKNGCKLVIIACHTASAKALRRLQQEYLPANFPENRILGVVVPLVEEALKFSPHKRLGIIGTRATIESNIYLKELSKLDEKAEIYQQACALLVPLVEEGWTKRRETRLILKKYLYPLKIKKIDALILGCTHYPFLFKEISDIMGKRVNIINPSKIITEKLKDYLTRHKELEEKLSKNHKIIFYTTGDEKKFRELGQKFLGGNMPEVKKIIL